jgi:hypothetical protein
MAVMESIKTKFAEYEYTIKLLTAKLEELAAENESLRCGLGAHGVLKLVYSDDKQPAGVRVKAAQAALNVEKPKLMPEKAPLELTAEPAPLPLAEVVRLQRARADALQGLPLGHPKYRDWVWDADESKWAEQVRRLESSGDGNSGNGGNSDDSKD